MQSALRQPLNLTFVALLLVIMSTGVASAQEETAGSEASVSVETSVEVNTTTNTSTSSQPTRLRPIQLFQNNPLKSLRDNAQDAIKDVQKNVRDLHLNTRVDMQAASTSEERKNIIESLREKQEELKKERKTRIENFKERMQMLARTHLGAVINRFSAAIRHFDNIAERIESRLEKLEERGVETASVEASLETAVTLTTTAKADLDALKTLINSVTDSSDPDTVKSQIRTAIQKATASVKAAHQALIKTARELSALVRTSAEINSETEVDTE